MEGLTGEERSELGKLAAQKRWSKETTTEK
jgi:hypothetical protein